MTALVGMVACQMQASSPNVQKPNPELTQKQKYDFYSTLNKLGGYSIYASCSLHPLEEEESDKSVSEIWIDLSRCGKFSKIPRLHEINRVRLVVEELEKNEPLVNWIRSQDIGGVLFKNIHSLAELALHIGAAAYNQKHGLRQTMSIEKYRLGSSQLALSNIYHFSCILISRLGYKANKSEFDFKNRLLPYLPERLDEYLSSSDRPSPVSTEDENHND